MYVHKMDIIYSKNLTFIQNEIQWKWRTTNPNSIRWSTVSVPTYMILLLLLLLLRSTCVRCRERLFEKHLIATCQSALRICCYLCISARYKRIYIYTHHTSRSIDIKRRITLRINSSKPKKKKIQFCSD